MVKRPNIAIKINQTYTKEDINKLKEIKTQKKIEKTMKEFSKGDKYQLALEKLYLSYDKNKTLDKLKEKFISKNKEKKIFQKEKYLIYLKESISSKQIISQKTIENLAINRIKNIKHYLINEKNIKENRVIIKKLKESVSNKNFTNFELEISVVK